MKAMIITGFGGPEVFQEAELPKPEPGVNELLVRVKATSVNSVDYKIRRSGSWAGIKPPAVIGWDVAGVVESIGPGVRDFKPGDDVYYTPPVVGGQGSYAEYSVANEAIVALKPRSLSFEEAAAVPLAGGTAWQALVDRVKICAGETALITAGAGGVGSMAVQIARASGARVISTASHLKMELVRSLGSDRVVDYHAEDYVQVVQQETDGEGVDVVFDTVGGDTLSQCVSATRRHGRMVSIVSTEGNLSGAFAKNITIHLLSMERGRRQLDALRVLIDRGQIRPVIDSVLPLNQVAIAHERLEKGDVRGKIVLRVE